MSWICSTCGLTQARQAVRCAVDGSLRVEPGERPAPARRVLYPGLEPLQRDEEALVGETADATDESEWTRSQFRPARFAGITALLWLLAPALWAFFQKPSLAPVVVGLFAIAGGVMLLMYIIVLASARRRGEVDDAVPGPLGVVRLTVGGAWRWVMATFPRGVRPNVGADNPAGAAQPAEVAGPPPRVGVEVRRIRLRAGLQEPVTVTVTDPDRWPPPAAPTRLRIVGRWVAEPERFDARLIEAVDVNGNVIRRAVRAQRPLGWTWAAAILVGPAIATGVWLANLRIVGT